MPVTYDPIATNTLSSAVSTLTFSSIPQTYTDLILVCNLGQSGPANVALQYNGDTGANYDATVGYGIGGIGIASGAYPNLNFAYGLNAAGQLPSTITASGWINIFSYSSTVVRKSTLSRYASQNIPEITNFTSTWRNTAAITSIRIFSYSDTYLAGSSFTLYGIKAA
jgi:hypothetical protein